VWMNMQAFYDLEVAKDELEATVEREVTTYADLQRMAHGVAA
jgi:hypothetical protein